MKTLSDITVIAQSIHADEKCYGLSEAVFPRPRSYGRQRYQLVYVNRNDSIVPFVRPLDSDLETPPLRIPSLGDDTVGELMDLADEFRINHNLDQLLKEKKESSTLINDVIALSEMIQRVKANKTVFGAGNTTAYTQRNGFHLKGNK